jgi:uncharacterized protein YmfQ (DUF2313 family)
MSDRQVCRNGDDYAEAFADLLPVGQAWPREPDSALMAFIGGLSQIWGDPVDAKACVLLRRESDPRETIELLPEWERAWNLPDPCYEAPQSIDERQLALVMRMTMLGAQSREFFISVAAQLGYTITISEYRTFVVGIDRVGDSRVFGVVPPDPMLDEWGKPIKGPPGDHNVANGELSEWPQYGLGPPENRFYWTVHVDTPGLIWFRCASGQCGVDPHLRIKLADDLECLLERWKPAHSQIIFDYSGLSNPGDPMAGTP